MVPNRLRLLVFFLLATGLGLMPTAAHGAAPSPCFGQAPTILGTPGDDVLPGTSGPDVVAGLGGNDRIRGLRGLDRICGGPGDDRIVGGRGWDRLAGGE